MKALCRLVPLVAVCAITGLAQSTDDLLSDGWTGC